MKKFHKLRLKALVLTAWLTGFGSACPVQAASFEALPGAFWVLSNDGSTVAGTAGPALTFEPFLWTQTGGIVDYLGVLPGFNRAGPNGISHDASVVVGTCGFDSDPNYRAFLWTQAGMVDLGAPPGEGSAAASVSADGSVVIGSFGGDMARWTEAEGWSSLGFSSGGAVDASADASVLAVESLGGAFRWTQETGLAPLGFLPGDTASAAFAISSDGSTIVGTSWDSPDDPYPDVFQAFRWTEAEGMVGLGHLQGDDPRSIASAVSDDGAIVVGRSYVDTPTYQGRKASIWDADHGMRDLQQVLIDEYGLGDELAGWTLKRALAISDDGRVICGNALGPNGSTTSWYAVIPEPSTAALAAMGCLSLLVFGCRRGLLNHKR